MENTTTKTATKSKPNFFDLTDIEIPLTYDFLPGTTMKFFFRIQLAKEEREARQVYFALTEEEREVKQHEHNVKLLASLATRPPENVPTFPTGGNGNGIEQTIVDFFSGENAMKKKVVEDALNLYFTKTQPAEFFR